MGVGCLTLNAIPLNEHSLDFIRNSNGETLMDPALSLIASPSSGNERKGLGFRL